MFTARAASSARRSVGFASGFGPPDFTAIAMSLPTRVKAFAILFQRANIVALRFSKIRPMGPSDLHEARSFVAAFFRSSVQPLLRRRGIDREQPDPGDRQRRSGAEQHVPGVRVALRAAAGVLRF